jgi:hypothetical protein
MDDESDGIDESSNLRLWLRTSQGSPQVPKQVTGTWMSDFHQSFSDFPYEVDSLELIEVPGSPVFIAIDLDGEFDVKSGANWNFDRLRADVSELLWPGLGVELVASEPDAVAPGERKILDCGCIGRHQRGCRYYVDGK